MVKIAGKSIPKENLAFPDLLKSLKKRLLLGTEHILDGRPYWLKKSFKNVRVVKESF